MEKFRACHIRCFWWPYGRDFPLPLSSMLCAQKLELPLSRMVSAKWKAGAYHWKSWLCRAGEVQSHLGVALIHCQGMPPWWCRHLTGKSAFVSAASGLPAMLGRSLWAHCETWFLFFFSGLFLLGSMPLVPVFFYTGHLETVGYASWTCFFLTLGYTWGLPKGIHISGDWWAKGVRQRQKRSTRRMDVAQMRVVSHAQDWPKWHFYLRIAG